MKLENDFNMLSEISKGNPSAFESLFNAYKNVTYSYALKICQSETLAEEIVQDVFMNLWINRVRLQHIDNFGGYLRVITRNEALQVLRRLALQARCYEKSAESWTEQHNETEGTILYNESRQILDRALKALPPQQQLIYKMCHLDGMKQQEIADQLQISPLTVKAHLRQAVQRVRKFFSVEAVISIVLILIKF